MMYNSDVRELFERVNIGTMVIIKDFTSSWDAVAMEHGYKLEEGVCFFSPYSKNMRL